jgi:ribosomal protein S18 acetylase RimI-like enzyme
VSGPPTVSVREVTEGSCDLHRVLSDLLPQLSSQPPPFTKEHLEEIVASPASRLLVAEDGSEVVGTLTLALFRVPTGMRAWIEDVVVDGSRRGQGVGEALVQAALELAASCGSRTVDLTSRPTREAANRLYRRLGFTERRTNVYRYQAGE